MEPQLALMPTNLPASFSLPSRGFFPSRSIYPRQHTFIFSPAAEIHDVNDPKRSG
jgi:hypothetical protein